MVYSNLKYYAFLGWLTISILILQLVLEAKCHVVRDAQVIEKNKIKKELETEERRLDHEMEVDRINAIKIEEEIERKRRNERMIGAMTIMDQIKHNQMVNILEFNLPSFCDQQPSFCYQLERVK